MKCCSRIGWSGACAHWKLAQEEFTTEVFVAPGNPVMALEEKVTCTGIGAGDFNGIADSAGRIPWVRGGGA